MKVSVVIITFNQEKYIAQAIDTVLMQQVNFDYEIIIGDDCSTDGTRDIVSEYKEKYPDRIRLLLAEENYGDYGRTNFIRSLKASKGEYIALLDGDDYWTRDCKLQMQVEFLDEHSDCTLCCHFFTALDDRGKKKAYYPPRLKRIYTLKHLLLNNFIGSSTVMLRNGTLDDFPSWYYESQMIGDWPLYVLYAQHGNIGCLRNFGTIKRVHARGVYSRLNFIEKINNSIKAREFLDEQLNYKYDRIFRRYYAGSFLLLGREYVEMGERRQATHHLRKALSTAPFRSVFSAILYEILVKLYLPWTLPFFASFIKPVRKAVLKTQLKFKFKKLSPRSS